MNRFGQPVKVDEGDFDNVQLRHMRMVVRPVGPWRFLTPIDIVQEDDLFRIIAEETEDEDAAYNANWSPISQGTDNDELIGKSAGAMPNRWEIIRALEHGYTTPMFDLPPPKEDEGPHVP